MMSIKPCNALTSESSRWTTTQYGTFGAVGILHFLVISLSRYQRGASAIIGYFMYPCIRMIWRVDGKLNISAAAMTGAPCRERDTFFVNGVTFLPQPSVRDAEAISTVFVPIIFSKRCAVCSLFCDRMIFAAVVEMIVSKSSLPYCPEICPKSCPISR